MLRGMRWFVFILFFIIPTLTGAESSLIRLTALLNICEVAQRVSDTTTIQNVANQIKDIEKPNDFVLAQKFDNCLTAAFGRKEQSRAIDELLQQITENATQMQIDCRELLNAAPEQAINHPICKSILID